MLSPRMERDGADPGEFDIFVKARVKFPTPRHLLNVLAPIWPLSEFPTLGQIPNSGATRKCQNPYPGEGTLRQIPVSSPPPSTLGFNIDR